MLRLLAILFGIGFICAGVAGYLPTFTTDGLLFGYFQVDSMHNLVHIVSGVLAIMAATSYRFTRLYFQVIGLVYGVLTIAGVCCGGNPGMMMHINGADNFLHAGIAVVSLYLGFLHKKAN